MARAKISDTTKNLVNDDGSVRITVARGEQIHIEFSIDWVPNLTGYNVHARIVEGVNDGSGGVPTGVKPGGQMRLLTPVSGHIIGLNSGGNTFKLVIPWDIAKDFAPQPQPDKSVFAYIDVEVGEPGSGDPEDPVGDPATPNLQVWKPVRGLVEIMYSPTEV